MPSRSFHAASDSNSATLQSPSHNQGVCGPDYYPDMEAITIKRSVPLTLAAFEHDAAALSAIQWRLGATCCHISQ